MTESYIRKALACLCMTVLNSLMCFPLLTSRRLFTVSAEHILTLHTYVHCKPSSQVFGACQEAGFLPKDMQVTCAPLVNHWKINTLQSSLRGYIWSTVQTLGLWNYQASKGQARAKQHGLDMVTLPPNSFPQDWMHPQRLPNSVVLSPKKRLALSWQPAVQRGKWHFVHPLKMCTSVYVLSLPRPKYLPLFRESGCRRHVPQALRRIANCLTAVAWSRSAEKHSSSLCSGRFVAGI